MNRKPFLLLAVVLLASCVSEDPARDKATPERDITAGAGYFSVRPDLIDSIVIRRYHHISDDQPWSQVVIEDPAVIGDIVSVLSGLPVTGDIHMKIAASASHTHVRFRSNSDIVGEAHIYGGQLQRPDTAFSLEAGPEEKRIVKLLETFEP